MAQRNNARRPAKKIAGWVPPASADEREIIGHYELTGKPVYNGDDYMIDQEGCYFTREDANDLIDYETKKLHVPATTPFCHRRPACQNPTCRYSINCNSQTLQPPAL